MECFIVEQSDVREASHELWLSDEESHHLRVLRIREGEQILATNLLGTCYLCDLAGFEGGHPKHQRARCVILEVWPDYGEPKTDVMLIQGMLQQPARWEWLLEKATELGVRVIQPVETNRTEKRGLRLERSEHVLRAAAKQSRRANKPWLKELSSLSEALAYAAESGRRTFFLHEEAKPEQLLHTLIQHSDSRIALVVGPEGGFDEEEVAMAARLPLVTLAWLGKRRLRAETSAIAALAIAIRD